LLLYFSISSAADKDVEDYYTRKRHLPDLAARGTLPLHVLKMSQDQVGTQVHHLWQGMKKKRHPHSVLCFNAY